MTITKLDVTLPAQTNMVADLVTIGQETRTTVNELIDAVIHSVINAITLVAGVNTLAVGTDDGYVNSAPLEVIQITGDVSGSSLSMINGGTEGQIKILIFTNTVTVTDSATGIKLNSLPYPTDFVAQAGDVLELVNEGGDPDIGVHGTWRELYRTVAV